MRKKLITTKEKSLQMSRVHSTGGKDEVIIRKLLWHKGIRYRINDKKLPENLILRLLSIRLQFLLMANFGMDMSGKNISQGSREIESFGLKKSNRIWNATKR